MSSDIASILEWYSSQTQTFPYSLISQDEKKQLSVINQNGLDSYRSFLERRRASNLIIFDKSCKALSSIVKKVALENNVGKIAELDSFLVGFTSYVELCKQSEKKENQQGTLENFSKQIDCLKQIKRHCEWYKSYESYLPVIYDSVPGVDKQFSLGLPLDSVHKSLHSCLTSLRNLNFDNSISLDYIDLLNIRMKALQRAKALYSQLQVSYMDRYAIEYPLDKQTAAFLNKRGSLIKSIDSALAKTALALSENKSKSQENSQQSQQAQDPASNKKTKSSPDLER